MAIEVDLSRLKELSVFTVPEFARGVWQRHSVRLQGSQSDDHRVIWIQTPTLYADIRTCRRGQDTLCAPADQGFAGLLHVSGQVFHWQRPIDLTPGPEGSDQGAMFRDEKRLYEVGLFKNYLEEYHQVASPAPCFAASRGAFRIDQGQCRFEPDQPLEILVRAGSYVTHARRAGNCALRQGQFDARSGTVNFEAFVGDLSVFSHAEGPWTVWTDDAPDRDTLLGALAAC